MCRYAVELSESLRYSTIQNYISGVLSLNRYFGYDAKNVRSDFEFVMTLSGIRRVLGDPTPVRPSFTLKDLVRMSECVNFSIPEERCMWACLALSFRALLRKSNIVPDSLLQSEGHFLRRGAVCLTEWGLEVKVSSSKTVQYMQRVHKIPITMAIGSPLCAASLVRQHVMDFPSDDPESPFFVVRKGSKIVPLTYSVLMVFLKRLMKSSGFDPHRAGMHSLRRAGALYMYSVGLTIEDIRQAGDWQSMAALIYLTKPYSVRIETDEVVSRCLASSLSVD